MTAAVGSPVRDTDGVLLAHAWVTTRGWLATGYQGRGFVTVPTQGPYPTRADALAAVGVVEDTPGRGWLETPKENP